MKSIFFHILFFALSSIAPLHIFHFILNFAVYNLMCVLYFIHFYHFSSWRHDSRILTDCQLFSILFLSIYYTSSFVTNFIFLLIFSFIYLFISLFNYLFIYFFIYLFIYLFISPFLSFLILPLKNIILVAYDVLTYYFQQKLLSTSCW